jgi:hypothetical protein
MTAMPPISPSSALPAGATFTIPENNEELGEAITRLAGHINAAQYRFLKLLGALVERDAWLGESGMKSPAHWLNYYCGIDLGAAREKVRVAKCLATLPQIDAAFSTGVISYSKVRAMTRSATPENEAFLLQVAKYGTAQHVEKLVRKFAWATRLNNPQRDKCQYEAREFGWYEDDDGMVVFKGRLPAAEGAAFLKAMEAIMQAIGLREPTHQESTKQEASDQQPTGQEVADVESTGQECTNREWTDPESVNPELTDQEIMSADVSAETPDEDATPTCAQKRADALVAMADLAMASLATDGKSACTADKYQVVIHIDANRTKDVSAETFSSPHCSLERDCCHFPLAASTARRLACDASLVTVLEDASGTVLNVGRKTRTIPPAIRRALTLRDQGCRFPGCCETRFVDAHHIHHWCDGGETRLDNLILMCRLCRARHNRHYADSDIMPRASSAGLYFSKALQNHAA